MAWLLRDGEVLATLEVVEGLGARLKGLLGRDSFEGAFLIRPARSIHTIGMRFPIDVAYCSADLVVLDCRSMAPNRLGRPRAHARCVIEASKGAFERWGLRPGDHLEIKG